MPSNREAEREIGYPGLSRVQINLVIDSLLWSVRNRDLGKALDPTEETIGKLANFYTRRWGLPPALVGRVGPFAELAPDAKS